MSWNKFVEEVDGGRRRKCGVCLLLSDVLPKEGRKALDDALKRTEITSSAIRKALLSKGVREDQVPSVWSFNHHRRNECKGTR